MTYAVVLRFDPAGPCLRILHDDSPPLPGREGVRYPLLTHRALEPGTQGVS
jgi:hypothetical protein